MTAAEKKIVALAQVGVCSLKAMYDAFQAGQTDETAVEVKKKIVHCVAGFMTEDIFSTYYDEAKKLRADLSAVKYDLDVMVSNNPNTAFIVKNVVCYSKTSNADWLALSIKPPKKVRGHEGLLRRVGPLITLLSLVILD
jgi:predicted ester cyclase